MGYDILENKAAIGRINQLIEHVSDVYFENHEPISIIIDYIEDAIQDKLNNDANSDPSE